MRLIVVVKKKIRHNGFFSKKFNINKLNDDIKLLFKGNKSEFARVAGLNPTTVYSWFDVEKKAQPTGENLTKISNATDRPSEEYYIQEYQQPKEVMIPPKNQGSRDSKGSESDKSGLGRYAKVKLAGVPLIEKYIDKVKGILNSEHTSISTVLMANIDQFDLMIEEREESVRERKEHEIDKDRILVLEQKIKILEKGLKRAENFACGSAEDADDADRKG